VSNFSPVWRLKINSVEYTNLILSNLTVTSGRTDIYQQPVAGYVNLTVINLDQSDLPFNVSQSVSIELQDSTGIFVPIFGGIISDLELSIAQIGNVGYSQSYKITALGALAKLPKTLFNLALNQDYDGEQIYKILRETLFNQWQNVPAALTWATYDPTVTWENAENNGLGEIDRPGDYLMINRGADPVDSYSLASQIALSGLGYLYETAQGQIGYADSTHRTEYLSVNGYVEISAAEARAAGLMIRTRAGDVRNDVTIQYGASAASHVEATDPQSIGLYGSLAQVFTTYLKNTTDAEDQADFYLELRAYPKAVFDSITYDLTNAQIDDSDRDSLINVFMGMPVNITNLPLNMNAGTFNGFVEGWTLQAAYNELSIQLFVSPISFSLQAMRWNSVPVVELWSTVNPLLTWENATIVA
tara:strand:+ start:504 stop:1751 length:1248 start_codon:yes stop_codon:yes gene_type:complete